MNHLLFIVDLSKNQIDFLVQTVQIFSKDIGMQFGIKKCGVLIMEREKVIRTDGVRRSDRQDMKDMDGDGYTYLGN